MRGVSGEKLVGEHWDGGARREDHIHPDGREICRQGWAFFAVV